MKMTLFYDQWDISLLSYVTSIYPMYLFICIHNRWLELKLTFAYLGSFSQKTISIKYIRKYIDWNLELLCQPDYFTPFWTLQVATFGKLVYYMYDK